MTLTEDAESGCDINSTSVNDGTFLSREGGNSRVAVLPCPLPLFCRE